MSGSGSVFLIGPMGAGKSTIGRHLAELLRKEFVDSDHEIERRTGASIPLIFEIEGEPGFRRRESAVLEELTARADIVLATGGGAVLAEDNRETLRARGTVVYLEAPLDTLLARTHRDKNRPLLQDGDRRGRLEEILRVREPLYRATAHLVVATDHRAPAVIAQEIAAKLREPRAHENATA
ncbi:shikimate kinase [Sulfurifustis variabilis]|uniref:Shikimate kinase n=1 Tax=Sulfurifustis variabilis TaxID=1675686 RepID=A0A1B4UZR0_9GAMM|nr:shikimate kinase AroK [Sulfurifustis variabilis]BAU46636.1 shikimate kinase [Sulfurifustis variabilis]